MRMNISLILRDSWRITWRNWPLWALTLLMALAFVPAGLLSGAFGLAAEAASFRLDGSPLFSELAGVMAQLRSVTAPAWLGIALAALILLVVTSAVTLTLQAASMRGAALAAVNGKVSFREALALGRDRIINIVKLSLAFGILIALLSLLPSLALALVGDRSPLGVTLINLVRTGLTPINIALNLLLLLLLMSIALEDFKPGAAFGRARLVFRRGWWAFLLVVGLSAVSALLASAILAVPLAAASTLAVLDQNAGLIALTLTCLCAGPLAGFFFLFTAVFTQALYTLVYREAANLTQS